MPTSVDSARIEQAIEFAEWNIDHLESERALLSSLGTEGVEVFPLNSKILILDPC
jgi:hypothetical protein